MSTVLAILTRSPVDPRIKTRLSPMLPADASRRELALAFIDDEIAHCRRVAGAAFRIAVAAPVEGLRMNRPGLGGDLILAQRGATSAERQGNVLADLARTGFTSAIIMGADVPDLPPRLLGDAVAALEADPNAVVLGPAPDGGYYLLGLRVAPGPIPDLFATLRWSTPSECGDMAAAIDDAGRTIVALEEWRDVDTPEDLSALADRLRRAPDSAPMAAAALKRLGLVA
jgi:glycosyltransferase A (GT-A) superfamily protein (DUF2064 family)